jgi:predicted nucleic acid-binding Zn ribbon protein
VGVLPGLLGYITTAVLLIGGVITYFLRRRGTTGQVKTSDAATLWAQAQEMRAQLIAEKTRAEDQRDRVMAIQSAQVVPVLESTAESLRQILAALAQINETLARLSGKYL